MRCDLCPAFKANRAGADLERASVVWASLFDVHLTPDQVACGGCRGQAEELLDQACPVRPCVLSKGLEDCSQCADMPCENLKRRWVSRCELEAKLGRPVPEDDYRKYVLPFENAPYLLAQAARSRRD
jgi:hypothetical protein